MIKKVVIDGVHYVPAMNAAPSLNAIMQALYESYMGVGRDWNWHDTDNPRFGDLHHLLRRTGTTEQEGK